MATLKEILAALKGAMQIELTVKGRVSGKVSTRPVWFVLGKDNRSIALIPVDGRKTQWYLNAIKDPSVSIRVAGCSFTGKIRELGKGQLTDVLEMFTAKYGKRNMELYYPRKDVAVELCRLEPADPVSKREWCLSITGVLLFFPCRSPPLHTGFW